MKNIADRLTQLDAIIRALEIQYQRPPGSVRLLAVSKTWSANHILAAQAAGQLAFGENYVQEASEKIRRLRNNDIEWHFIGSVQSNKTSLITQHFHWCHSVDRLKIARRLGETRDVWAEPLNICIQVNISQEAGKAGVDENQTTELCSQIRELPKLRLRGLMAMPKQTSTLTEQRQSFRKMRVLLNKLNACGFCLDTLSMGTTQDMEAAIAEGATIVRIGSGVFGGRPGIGKTRLDQ